MEKLCCFIVNKPTVWNMHLWYMKMAMCRKLRIIGHIIFTFCFCFILGYLEFSTESQKNNMSLQNENESESFLILYRKIMIPVATFISCIFAFIIVRELRLHYAAPKATATNERTEKKYTNGVYIVWRYNENNWTIFQLVFD